jgi:hypothetical protein
VADLVDALVATMRAGRGLDPRIVHGIASSPDHDVDEMVEHAEGINAFTSATQFRRYVEDQATSVQNVVWARLSPEERAMLQGAGYQPPITESRPSLLGGAFRRALLGFGGGLTVLGEGIEGRLGEMVEGLGKPLEAVKHVYRAGALAADEAALAGGQRLGGLGTFLSPGEWGRLWRETQPKERTFSPLMLRALAGDERARGFVEPELRAKLPTLDAESLEIAQDLAEFRTEPELGMEKALGRVDEEHRAGLVDRIQNDQELQQAVTLLEGSKLSFGRRLAASLGVTPDDSAWNVVSGSADATWTWFSDPLIVGLKVRKGLQMVRFGIEAAPKAAAKNPELMARYLIQNAEDVERISRHPSVVRHLDDAATYLQRGAYGELIERYPQYAGVVGHLEREGVTTAAQLGEWLKGAQGMTALLSGQMSGVHRATVMFPRLTHTQRAGLAAKKVMKETIDFLADSPQQIAEKFGPEMGVAQRLESSVGAPLGQILRRLTTLAPKGVNFDPSSPEAVTHIQRIAAYALPAARQRELVDTWVKAPDLGAKYKIYKGLLSEVFNGAGVHSTPEGARWAKGFFNTLDDIYTGRTYAPRGLDQVMVEGQQLSAGVLENQLTLNWAMPSFRRLWFFNKRMGFHKWVHGHLPHDQVDYFMEQAWKPLVLLRLGFPIRAGGEEIVGAMLREGAGPIRGRLAASVGKREVALQTRKEALQRRKDLLEKAATKRSLGETEQAENLALAAKKIKVPRIPGVLPFNPITAAYRRYLTNHPSIAEITDEGEVAARILGERAARTLNLVEGKLAGDDYVQGARELWEHGIWQDAFAREVSATHRRGAGYLANEQTAEQFTRSGRVMRPAYLSRTGKFKDYSPSDNYASQALAHSLDEVGNSKMARSVLERINAPREDQVRAVKEVLTAPGYEKLTQRSVRTHYTRDGRSVALGEVSPEEAVDDWANVVVDMVNSTIKNKQGQLLVDDVAERLLRGESFEAATLEAIPAARWPDLFKGPEVLPVSRNWFANVIDQGFARMVGPYMDWLAREGMFLHNYVLAKREVAGLARFIDDPAKAEAVLRDSAVQRALNKTIPFIHDPEVRSQAAIMTRNFAPFWFAQEQFYKRVAKTMVHSPERLRQMQLMVMGIRHAGILHKDDEGEEYFLYPAVGAMQDALTKGFELVTGYKAKLPLPANFRGKVKFVTPGLERIGLPSFGPLVAVGMNVLRRRFPELIQLERGLLGERGAGRPIWEQVTPTTFSRIWHFLADKPETSPYMASAMMQAMMYLDANNLAPPADASAEENEAYIERVTNWTRVLFLTRLIFGYSVPAAPEVELDPDEMHQEFRQLLKQLPIEEAVSEFLRRNPDASAYTVFQSKSAAGAPLPSTEQTLDFMEHNRAFLSSYPSAGGWFLPQEPAEEFSIEAYREQLALELRTRKAPKDFYRDVKFAEGAETYFASKKVKDETLKASVEAGDSTRSARIRESWRVWKEAFFKAHPIFAEELMSSERTVRRQRALEQLRMALEDSRVPENEQTTHIHELLTSYDRHLAFQRRLVGMNTKPARDAKARERATFAAWAEDYITEHADVAGLYRRLMEEDFD